MPDAPTDKIAELLSDRRLRLACQNAALSAETEAMRGDNLAIHLATEISRHPDRPEDDKADDETGWGEWVIERTNEIGDAVVAAVAAVLLRDTPALIAHLEEQGYAVVPREPTEEMVERAFAEWWDHFDGPFIGSGSYAGNMVRNGLTNALRAALNPEPQL